MPLLYKIMKLPGDQTTCFKFPDGAKGGGNVLLVTEIKMFMEIKSRESTTENK